MVASKKSGSHRTKSKQIKHVAAEKRTPAKPHSVAHAAATVTINRRESRDRRAGDRRSQAAAASSPATSSPATAERRVVERRTKVSRRRQIDPTTCERDYTPEEIEFMGALDEYKRRNGRMFPTCSEVLEVIRSLGYVKMPKVESAPLPIVDMPTSVLPDMTAV